MQWSVVCYIIIVEQLFNISVCVYGWRNNRHRNALVVAASHITPHIDSYSFYPMTWYAVAQGISQSCLAKKKKTHT